MNCSDHEKQAAHGWGGEDGNSEWKDEQAGEAIAQAEAKDDAGFTPDTGAGDPAFTNGPGAEGEEIGEDAVATEQEDKTKSYDQYLAEQAEKRLALGGDGLKVRKANEGSKQKFPEGTAVARDPDTENFFIGSGGKARREKTNQHKKEQVQLDGQYYAASEGNESRGGRGRGRGGRGRGGDDRGGPRGGRGGPRGGRGEGFRGGRSERGGARGSPRGDFNTQDSSAFPALGA
jgi:plasminogen activator inhibitor 1 RNA-binding protein